MRIVIELKRGEIPEVIINQLYKFTDLQVTFGCNMLALDKGLPRTMNVKQMILAWIDHRIEVIRRRTRFELNKAEARAHILEGYLKAIDHLDEVVKLIRASNNREEAKTALIERFEFTRHPGQRRLRFAPLSVNRSGTRQDQSGIPGTAEKNRTLSSDIGQ